MGWEWEFLGEEAGRLVFRTVGYRVVDDAAAVDGWRAVQELELTFSGAPGAGGQRLLMDVKPLNLKDARAAWPGVELVDLVEMEAVAA